MARGMSDKAIPRRPGQASSWQRRALSRAKREPGPITTIVSVMRSWSHDCFYGGH
jgi:hypothetical protein